MTDAVPDNFEDLKRQFCTITGADENIATNMLQACQYDVDMAIGMQMDAGDVKPSVNHNSASVAGTSSSGRNQNEDEVRAPIPPTREVLVPDERIPTWARMRHVRNGPTSVFDPYADFAAVSRDQERAVLGNGTLDDQSLDDKRKSIQDLFRPPYEIMHRGTLEMARQAGQKSRKWLLVNIQDCQEFSSCVLNRDVWKDPAVIEIVRENFIFWQASIDSPEGKKFQQFYHVNKFPFVAVLDPRTGEQMAQWDGNGELDAETVCSLAADFLALHLDQSMGQNTTPEPDTEPPRKRFRNMNIRDVAAGMGGSSDEDRDAEPEVSIIDASEDAQLAAAIAASLRTSGSGVIDVSDDDTASEDDCRVVGGDFDVAGRASARPETKPQCGKAEGGGTATERKAPVDGGNEAVGARASMQNPGSSSQDQALCASLLLRLPDGTRRTITCSAGAEISEVAETVEAMGYPADTFEIVTNFPRRNLSEVPPDSSLEGLGLCPRSTLFVQER